MRAEKVTGLVASDVAASGGFVNPRTGISVGWLYVDILAATKDRKEK